MSITKVEKKRYRVFPTYISYDGKLVPAGEYDEDEFDINEAREKSTAILVNASAFAVSQVVSPFRDTFLNAPNETQLVTTITSNTINKLKINTCTATDIESLKFVGRIAAQKIVEARKNGRIKSYQELDKIAPIKGGKTWVDISIIDFETLDPTLGLVYDGLKTFGYNAENTHVPKPTTSA